MTAPITTSPAGGAATDSVPPSQMTPEAYRQAALQAFGDDPVPGFKNPEDEPGNDKPGFWSKVGQTIRKVDQQATFGLADAVNSASDAVVGAAVGVSKATGLYKVGRSPEEEKQFLSWWSQPTKEANGLHVSDETVGAGLGPDVKRGQDAVSHWSQMGGQILGAIALTHRIGVGSGTSKVAGAIGLGAKAAKVAGTLGEGAFIDGTFFDPYQARVTNLLENLSDKFGMDAPKRAFAMLAADPNDPEILARAKAVVEGAGLGLAASGIFKLVKVSAGARFLKTSTDEAAKKEVAAGISADLAHEAEPKTTLHDPDAGMTRVTNEDGTATLIHNDEADLKELSGLKEGEEFTDRERRLAKIAFTDVHTGLRNKAALQRALENTPAGGAEHVTMDLSGLKKVNDNISHAAGDAYLLKAGKAIKQAGDELGVPVRNLFHESGDEFSAIVPPGKGEAFLARVKELVGEEAAPNGQGILRMDGTVGVTRQAADEALSGFKKGRSAEFQREANGAPDVLPMAERPDIAAERNGQQSFTFASAEEADQVLHSAGEAVRDGRRPMWTSETVEQFKQELSAVTDEGQATGLFQRWGTHFNFRWNSAPNETLASIEAMSRQLPEAADIARALGTQPHEVTIKLAQDIYRDATPEQAMAAAKRLFGDTKAMPQQLLALKMHLTSAASKVRELSDLVDTQPNNPVVMDQMTEALDNLWDLHQHVSGTSANTARTLDAHQIDPQEALEGVSPLKPEAEAAAKADAEVAEAAGSKAEASPEGTPKAKPEAKPESKPKSKATEAPEPAPGDGKLSSKMTRQELRDLARNLRLTEGDPSAVLDALYGARFAKAARELKQPTLWDRAINFRMFAMLSHWGTWKVNAISNTMAAFAKPAELWVGSVGRGAEKQAQRQFAADQITGLFSELTDAWQAAARSAEVGDNLLDRNHKYFDIQGGGGLSNLSTGQSAAGEAVGAITRTYEVPSRVLMSTDEFFKQLNYRAHVRAQALQAARQAGITDTKVIAERVESSLRGSFAKDGTTGALNPNALEYARVATFTNTLENGTIGRGIQDFALKHPTMRMIFPFVRTPVNLMKWTWHRTPGLNYLSKEFRAELEAGGARAAAAKGQMHLGGAMYATAALATSVGYVTGHGPSNPAMRKEWLNAGNKPYSIKIPGTNEWVPYFRGDPVLTPVGLAADAAELGGETGKKLGGEVAIVKAERHQQGQVDPTDPFGAMLAQTADLYHAAGNLSSDDWTNASTAILASILGNISSKTFLRSATDFADAIGSGDPGKVRQFASSMATSFIPNFLTNEKDPYYRESRNVVDELLRQTPWSEQLEPTRNLLGEPVLRAPETVGSPFNPFTPQAGKNDPLLTELLDLGRAIPMPSPKIGAVDLGDRSRWGVNGKNQSPYDRMLELLAQPKDGGASLRDALTPIVNSPEYKNATDGTVAEPGGVRFRIVMGVIEAYRQKAEAQMLQEFPKVRAALTAQTAVRGSSAGGGEEGAARARLLFAE